MRNKIIVSILFITLIILIIKEKIRENNNLNEIYSTKTNSMKVLDSLKIEEDISNKLKEITLSVLWDTVDIKNSGIIMLNAKFVSEYNSGYRDIQLSYKNISGKNIKAVRFRWYGVNAFNEPADCGGNEDGFGGGFDDVLIRKNQTVTNKWSILSADGDKIVKAWPTEIIFTDGTKWSSKSKS